MLKVPRKIFAALFFAAACALSVAAQTDADRWENFDFANKTITVAQIKNLSEYDLKLVRGIVFGRHGRIFKDADIRNYLQARKWYKPNPNFKNSELNQTERKNLDVIREAEAWAHETVQPGDMRFYQAKLLTTEKLGEHTGAEWKILAAEIEAEHGKRFDDESWLQEYFDDRYWYAPVADYNPKVLSEIERKNLATIHAAEKKQRHVAISPGDMEFFQNTAITEQMLQGLSLYELRLLRNEIYARRGRTFKTAWLQNYFANQTWYEPREDGKEPELSPIEKQNVETIVRYENRLHDELSTQPVNKQLLDGLFLEDARKLRYEILARRGKVFNDKWLNKYFASFAWYKPNRNFKESDLNAVERQNVAAILAYERKATSVMDAIEG
jgi:hypothetical protein